MRTLIIVLLFCSITYSQHNSSYYRLYLSYAAEIMTYNITENDAYKEVMGMMPNPSPFVLNYVEVGYCSYNNLLMLGIYGSVSLRQPTGPINFTKVNINLEVGLHSGSIDIYSGFKGFILINLIQKGISSKDRSEINISYRSGQIYGYAADVGIRAFVTKSLMLTLEGDINFFIQDNVYNKWYDVGSITPYKTIIFDTFSLKGGFGIVF